MKKYIFLIVVICAAVPIFTWADDNQSKLEGLVPYIPSRIEWFALYLNANHRESYIERDFNMNFLANGKGDAIIIYVDYFPTVNREVMNREIDSMRKLILLSAKIYGWDSWLKVQERVQMLE